MNPTSVDIKAILEARPDIDDSTESSGTLELYPISISRESATVTNCITIFDTISAPDQLTYNREEKYEYSSVQIRIRSISYMEGWSIAELIKDILHGRANESWNGVYYALIQCMNGPFLLDYDDKQRARIVLNFNVQRR